MLTAACGFPALWGGAAANPKRFCTDPIVRCPGTAVPELP